MAIIGITGYPGSGKSMFAAAIIRSLLSASKRRVICNFHTRLAGCEFGLWPDMVGADNACCVIDEAQVWFPSRGCLQKTTFEDLLPFQQHRKNGQDIIWIAQDADRVDVALRELTSKYYNCRRLWRFGYAALSHELGGGKSENNGGKFYFIRKALADIYYSNEIIGERYGKGYGFGLSQSLSGSSRRFIRVYGSDLTGMYLSEDDPELPDKIRQYLEEYCLLNGLPQSFANPESLVDHVRVEKGYLVDGIWYPAVPIVAERARPIGSDGFRDDLVLPLEHKVTHVVNVVTGRRGRKL